MMGFGFGMGLWGWLLMILFWLILIVAAVWVVKLLFPASPGTRTNDPQPSSSEDILKMRYARGELTEEQYQQMLQTLRG